MNALIGCGAASGAFTSIILTPVELIKCQMQVPISEPGQIGPRPLTLISSIFRHYGILGFWHGQMGTLIRETGGSAAWFGSYEGVTVLFRRMSRASPTTTFSDSASTTTPLPPLPLYQQMLAGATAGIASTQRLRPQNHRRGAAAGCASAGRSQGGHRPENY